MALSNYIDAIEADITERIEKAYAQAIEEMQAKLADMLDEYENNRETWSKTYTEKQMLSVISDLRSQIKQLSQDLANAAKTAEQIVNDGTYSAFAEAHNWATFEAETALSIGTNYTLYNKAAVYQLLQDGKIQLPQASVKYAKEYRWDMQHITSAITQGILQGESIAKIYNRLLGVAGMSESSAMRMARTCMTGAMNAGTLSGYSDLSDMGVEIQKQWLATLDERTRHSHLMLDGEVQDLEEPFSNDLMYPGDPNGKAAEVYNCRCTTVGYFPGITDEDWEEGRINKLSDEAYEAWKAARQALSMAQAIVRGYVSGSNLLKDASFLSRLVKNRENAIEEVVTAQGYDGLPTIISESELGDNVLYRGVKARNSETLQQYHDDLLNGTWYYTAKYGGSLFGKGMYAAVDPSVADYYAAGDGLIEKMQLKQDARVFTWGALDLKREIFQKLTESTDLSILSDVLVADNEELWGDKGTDFVEKKGLRYLFDGDITSAAAAAGYDAVFVEEERYYVILNRTALEVVG